MPTKSKTITGRIKPNLRRRLDKLGTLTNRTKSHMLEEALENYVDLQEWQIDEIRKGVEEADRGEFLPDREFRALVKKLTRYAR